jgi:hypothetical protein
MTTVNQLRRLVGNPDVYAVQHKDGKWTPVREKLDDVVLQAHLNQEKTVGTYINVDDHAHLMVIDIDSGERDDAERVRAALKELGVTSIGFEFSGRKGFHLWVVVQEEVKAHDLRRLGRHALVLAELPPNVEVFPKQDKTKDLGNLVKLPEGIHQVTGNLCTFEGPFPRPMPVSVLTRILGELPEEVHARRAVSETRFPCMQAIQEEGVQEGGRNNQLYHLAAMLRRAGVTDDNTDLLVRRANELGDPLEESELEVVLESSKTGGPICHNIPEDRHCGELCIMERTKGLYTRPGQLRHAGAGENVVVTIKGRKGTIVELEHDDIKVAKASIKDAR